MKRNLHIRTIVLIASVTFGQSFALIVTSYLSRTKPRALHSHQRHGYEFGYNNYYNDNAIEPHIFNKSPHYDDPQYHSKNINQYAQNNQADFDTNHYSQDSTTHNKIFDAPKSKNNFDGITDLLSRVFPNQSKNAPHNSPLSPRVDLPHINISEDDVQKFTSQAISGGKFVSTLLSEVLLNTAKLAIGALENNKTVEATSYNDVCDFDDELCAEIEDALKATESFNVMAEKSRGMSVLDYGVTDVIVSDETPFKDYDVAESSGGRRAPSPVGPRFSSNTFETITSKSSSNNSYPNKYEEYYKQNLERELLSNEGGSPLVSLNERYVEPNKLNRSQLDTSSLLEKRSRESKKSNEFTPRLNVINSVDYEWNGYSESPIVDIYTNKAQKQARYGTFDTDANRMMHQPRRDEDQLKGIKSQRLVNPIPRINRFQVERNETPNPLKVDITDEALAFVRSLNLDVYEIYMSTRNSNSIDLMKKTNVVTLDDVILYCDRLRIRLGHEMPVTRYQSRSYETDYTGPRQRQYTEQSRRENWNIPTTKNRHNIGDIYEEGKERRRYNPNSDIRYREEHHRSVSRTIPIPQRRVDQQSRRNLSQSRQSTPQERVPRFKQHPTAREQHTFPYSSRFSTLDVGNRDSRIQRPQNQSRSSMSQLIAQPQRRNEFNGNARNGNRSKMSTVSLSNLIQAPRERDIAHVPTNKFREPYQEPRLSKSRYQSRQVEARDDIKGPKQVNIETVPQRIQPSLRELSERFAPPPPSSDSQLKDSTYYTNGALEIADKYGVDLRNVLPDSNEPITAEDVKHYIESRKSVRARGISTFPGQNDPKYIENESTYDEFASHFNSETLSRLQQLQNKYTGMREQSD